MKYMKLVALVTINNCTHHKTSEVLVIFHLGYWLQTKGILSSLSCLLKDMIACVVVVYLESAGAHSAVHQLTV